MRLVLNDYFFRNNTIVGCGYNEINSIASILHIIGVRCKTVVVESLELINQQASHIVDFYVDFASEIFKVEGHLPIVGIRNDREVRKLFGLFFNAVEGTDEPVFLLNSGFWSATVEGMSLEPNGVFHLVKHINLA